MPHLYGVSYFSSKGPTGDGRAKPDLVAPGERILSCAAGTSKRGRQGACQSCRLRRIQRHQHGGTARVGGDRGVPFDPAGVHRPAGGDQGRIFMSTATDLGRDRDFPGSGPRRSDASHPVRFRTGISSMANLRDSHMCRDAIRQERQTLSDVSTRFSPSPTASVRTLFVMSHGWNNDADEHGNSIPDAATKLQRWQAQRPAFGTEDRPRRRDLAVEEVRRDHGDVGVPLGALGAAGIQPWPRARERPSRPTDRLNSCSPRPPNAQTLDDPCRRWSRTWRTPRTRAHEFAESFVRCSITTPPMTRMRPTSFFKRRR